MEKSVIQIIGGITINVDVNVKKLMYVKKNPTACNCENRKYLASIMDVTTIICDEVIKSYDEKIKTIPKNSNEKKYDLKHTKFLYFKI